MQYNYLLNHLITSLTLTTIDVLFDSRILENSECDK